MDTKETRPGETLSVPGDDDKTAALDALRSLAVVVRVAPARIRGGNPSGRPAEIVGFSSKIRRAVAMAAVALRPHDAALARRLERLGEAAENKLHAFLERERDNEAYVAKLQEHFDAANAKPLTFRVAGFPIHEIDELREVAERYLATAARQTSSPILDVAAHILMPASSEKPCALKHRSVALLLVLKEKENGWHVPFSLRDTVKQARLTLNKDLGCDAVVQRKWWLHLSEAIDSLKVQGRDHVSDCTQCARVLAHYQRGE